MISKKNTRRKTSTCLIVGEIAARATAMDSGLRIVDRERTRAAEVFCCSITVSRREESCLTSTSSHVEYRYPTVIYSHTHTQGVLVTKLHHRKCKTPPARMTLRMSESNRCSSSVHLRAVSSSPFVWASVDIS